MEDDKLKVGASIAESGYIGWVVYVDGAPIFQSVPVNLKLIQPFSDAYLPETRREARNVQDWKNLPHQKIERLEVYGLHEFYTEQPLIRLDRTPGMEQESVRFCCMTMGGVAVSTTGDGQMRTGIAGWKVGWFNPVRKEFDLWEITRTGRYRLGTDGSHIHPAGPPLTGHPCWPRPHGFGIAPYVFGLTASEVPEAPVAA